MGKAQEVHENYKVLSNVALAVSDVGVDTPSAHRAGTQLLLVLRRPDVDGDVPSITLQFLSGGRALHLNLMLTDFDRLASYETPRILPTSSPPCQGCHGLVYMWVREIELRSFMFAQPPPQPL